MCCFVSLLMAIATSDSVKSLLLSKSADLNILLRILLSSSVNSTSYSNSWKLSTFLIPAKLSVSRVSVFLSLTCLMMVM